LRGLLFLKVHRKKAVSIEFRKQRLSDFYYGWSSPAAEFNRDEITDIGPHRVAIKVHGSIIPQSSRDTVEA
jgi:hypothetical protein